MNDFKSEEYKSETVFLLIGRILLYQKILPRFSIFYRLGKRSSLLKWSTDNVTSSGSTSDMSKHWQIILFGAFTHSKGCQLQGSHLYLACVELDPERFYPRIHQYELFLCSAVHCRDRSSCGKRWHSGIARGEWGCRRKGGRSACGVLSKRKQKRRTRQH